MAKSAQQLIAQGEGRRVEFKLSGARLDRLARTVAAFANTPDVGTILVGVDDAGRVIGAGADLRRHGGLAGLRRALLAEVERRVHPRPRVRVQVESVDGVPVVRITVRGHRWSAQPHACDGVVYVRQGAATVSATPAERAACQSWKRRQRWRGLLLASPVIVLAALILLSVGLYRLAFVQLGAGHVRLTRTPFDMNAFHPVWSPDGQTIAYHAMQGGNWDIWFMDPDGGRRRRVLGDPLHHEWVGGFSPDGRELVYVFTYESRSDLAVLDLDTGASRTIVTDGSWNGGPTWSPAGDQIVFTSDRVDGRNQLYLLNVAPSTARQLTRLSLGVQQPTFAPDGQRLVFISAGDVHLLDLESGAVRSLTRTPTREESPSFTPDGQWIIYTSERYGIKEILLMDERGHDVRSLSCFVDSDPAVSPDGRWVICSSIARDEHAEIYRLPFDERGHDGTWAYQYYTGFWRTAAAALRGARWILFE